ncbi:molybdate ABC transporter substrate-binding protein [Thalassoroseus pseudoceratinae]|uniref:molybdate ABC transporter substrate-binding protein n=1 Tax=Thalassoroseus pseudoceratinae TaxID=2713176 RepID=UPI00142300AF|nr:molybdate ABC transporter substrate-binding protein [Thalassoroseus pseudoceratinae]
MFDRHLLPPNRLAVSFVCSAVILVGLIGLLMNSSPTRPTAGSTDSPVTTLYLHCAAGCRMPMNQLISAYEKRHPVRIETNWAGSDTLLNQLEVSRRGDLYLAADETYIEQAMQRQLVDEAFSIATQKPVILIVKGNPKNITTIADLARDDVFLAIGNPELAAIGQKTRALFEQSGHWTEIASAVTDHGTYLPTVPEVANAVQIGSVDAGIVWNTIARQYPDLEAVRIPELDVGLATITLGTVTHSEHPESARQFARFLSDKQHGLRVFQELGWGPIENGAP